ncbi:C1 family peptidase [Bdellovibrio sp. HCB337]|uniref:C1 family peptidase n=1 Tax=Bdellovibrio sp. HCB337 TaxID=3394358 RepID=UPI0039A7179A
MNLLKSLCLILLFSSSSWAESFINVKTLNEKLEKENATWVAKENWLTRLPKAEIQRMLGLKGHVESDVEFDLPEQYNANVPSKFDWRNKGGRNWVSPMLNQANCGSCVAFAAIGVMETQMNIATAIPSLNVRLSTQQLFSCGGGVCDYGWYPDEAMDFLYEKGVTDEACMPYSSGASAKDVACNDSCADAPRRNYKISEWGRSTKFFRNLNQIREDLQRGPLIATLTVYSDFVSYSGGVYKRSKDAEPLGGHAVSIVGYDDSKQALIIRNSWGEEWGEKGYGYVSYDDKSGVGRGTWWLNVNPSVGGVAMVTPKDYTYITGAHTLTAKAAAEKAESISFSIFDGNNKSIWSSSCQGKACGVNFDSTQFADGRYEIQATSQNANGGKIANSVRHFFYIVNQKPELKLSFTGADGLDLNKPLSERPEFLVNVPAMAVPMSSIQLFIKDSKGKVTVKSSEVVRNNMKIGWRTNFVPNGTYEVWMVGKLQSTGMDLMTETPHKTVKVYNEPY